MTCYANQLDVEKALSTLGSGGPLALSLKGFESRPEQVQMMKNVLDAYNGNRITLIEAGTGTGKSLAYLIPAVLWAAQIKERTVISTNTINLQEQLLHKDVPLIGKALGIDVKAVIVKGMHNYLCLRKLAEIQQEFLLLTPQEGEELQKIEAWNGEGCDGSRSSLSFSPSPVLWEKVAAESDSCNRNSCPYYQECHFFKARRQASEAQILIVNHHLLFADLVYRAENDNPKESAGILPNYNRLILDEAHNIEDIATEYFASKISQLDIMRLLARLTTEKSGKAHGKLVFLKTKLLEQYRDHLSQDVSSIHERLNVDLPGLRRDVLQQAHETFGVVFEFVRSLQNGHSSDDPAQGENKLRILPHHHEHIRWKEWIIPRSQLLSDALNRYAQSLKAILDDIKLLKNSVLDEQIKSLAFEISAIIQRLGMCATLVHNFTVERGSSEKVRWIESQPLKTLINTSLVEANLDIAKTLSEYLFSKFSTIVLCSATLTTDRQFNFIRNRLGLTENMTRQRHIDEYIYNSPFDFQKQALLVIPNDLPSPSHPDFVSIAAEKIWQAVQASRGNAFILFTSYTMLKSCYELLKDRLISNQYHPLKHGDDERQILLNKFKKVDRSVLFGTDSFWEGVDVSGEALRCVIIVKLPFKVPSEPIIQARSESIMAKGGNPFMEYSLPQAIVKFKQGFGRLIRNKKDRGCIVCLDNRIANKSYGKLFLSSLPECEQAFVSGDELQQRMSDFYRRTYFLVK